MRLPTSPSRLAAGRRLLWRSLLGGALVAGAVLLFTGCQENRDEVGTQNVRLSDLRMMAVPRDGLGLLAYGLKVDDDSGWVPNRMSAQDSVDPKDTGHSLSKRGRLGGYELTYRDPLGFSSKDEERPLAVSTQLELFRDEAAASEYLHRGVDDVMRGRKLPLGKIAAAERFSGGDLGEEAEGFLAAVKVEGYVGYVSGVAFRRGRLVASTLVTQRTETRGPADALQAADALDERISGVATGEIHEQPVKLPPRKWWHAVPDPRGLTLEGRELARGARLTYRQYLRSPIAFGYYRQYAVRGGRLGDSRIMYLRTLAEAHKTARHAARNQRYLSSARGSETIAGGLLRRYFSETDFHPSLVAAQPLATPDRDTAAFRFTFDGPRARFTGVLVSVRRGRLDASVLVMGLETAVRPEDALALRGKLRARLAAA